MTEEMDKPTDDEVEANDTTTEINREEVYAILEKWKAALRFNQQLQSNYSEEITKWRSTRDQLKEEINAIREAAFEEKAIRDQINSKVAKLKEDRAAANTQIAILKQKRNDAWEHVKNIRNQLKELINLRRDAQQQLKPIYPMMKRLEEIDWEVMTTSMPFKQEEALMDEFEKIFNEISKRKQVINYDSSSLDFEEAKQRIDEFRESAQQFHDLMIQTVEDGEKLHRKILDLVKESEPHHQAMQDYFSQIDNLQKEEETAHQKMVDNIKELELLRKGKEEIYKELRALEKKLAYFKHLETLKKMKEQEALLDKKTQEALVKYQSGKKLTMDEFGLLLKKGLIKND